MIEMNERYRALDILLSIGLVVSLLLNGVAIIKLANMDSNVSQLMNSSGTGLGDDITSEEQISTGQTLIEGDTANEIALQLQETIENVSHSPSYMEIITGEETNTVTMFNTSGENITQTGEGDTMVFRSDNYGILFSDVISHGEDCHTLRILDLAAKAVEKGYAKLYEAPIDIIDESANALNPVEYFIEVEGYDNIEKMYDQVYEGFGSEMSLVLQTHINTDTFEGEDDTSELNLRFACVLENSELVSAACYTFFGENATGRWDNSYINWYFDGIYEIEDWKLPDTWYDFDFENSDENEDTADVLAQMLIDLHADVSEMLESLNTDSSDSETPELDTTEDDLDNSISDSTNENDSSTLENIDDTE